MFTTGLKEITSYIGLVRIHRKAAKVEVINHFFCSPTGNDDVITIYENPVYASRSRT
jgi:hypothetical protein